MKKGFVKSALKAIETLPEQGENFDPRLAEAICDFGASVYTKSPVVRALVDLRALGIPSTLTPYSLRLLKLMLVRRGNDLGKLPFDHLYRQFQIPKKDGTARNISAPIGNVRVIQTALKSPLTLGMECLFRDFGVNHVHGFRPNRSSLTAAQPHINQRLVMKLDISDFFDNTGVGSVKRALNLLLDTIGLRNRGSLTSMFLAYLLTSEGRLPTGSPTSPIISNAVLIHFDSKLAYYAKTWGVNYTRYADDLTFSGDKNVQKFAGLATGELEKIGYAINSKKTMVMRRGRAQVVCGLVVNEGLSIGRRYRRQLRAADHYSRTQRSPHLNGNALNSNSLRGHLSYVAQVRACQISHPPEIPSATLTKPSSDRPLE